MALNIGFGEYNITPPLGISMVGYAKREGVADDLHDTLKAKAMTFEDGEDKAAFIVADICVIPKDMYAQACKRIEEWTGIPKKNILIAGTHTHSGPTMFPKKGKKNTLGNAYVELLAWWIASAAKLAWNERKSSTLAYGSAGTREQTINRREPGASTDEEVPVLVVKRRGKIAGVLANYACHAVVMGPDNLAISGDFVTLARARLDEAHPDWFAMLAVAPSGDINPLPDDVKKMIKKKGIKAFTNDPFSGIYDRSGGTFKQTEKMAKAVADAIERAVEGADSLTGGGVGAALRNVNISTSKAKSKKMIAPVRVLRVGQAAIVGLPGEQFVDTWGESKAIVEEAGLKPIVSAHVQSLTYIPRKESFEAAKKSKKPDYEIDRAVKRGMSPDAVPRQMSAIKRALKSMA